MASSARYRINTPEEERWHGQHLFLPQEDDQAELIHSSRQSAFIRHENAHVSSDGQYSNYTPSFVNTDPCADHPAPQLASSVQSATGLGYRARAGKRKSRVSSKVPIRVFSADAGNFMAMVHKLTGFQSSGHVPENPLLKPLPYRPSLQGISSPEFSGYPAIGKMSTSLSAEKSPNTLALSNFASNQRVQLGSFQSSSPLSQKGSSMRGEQTSMAVLPILWQPMEEFCRKINEPCAYLCDEHGRLPFENASRVDQKYYTKYQG